MKNITVFIRIGFFTSGTFKKKITFRKNTPDELLTSVFRNHFLCKIFDLQ